MSENIVTGQNNNPVVMTQESRRRLSPLQRIPQGNPFVQVMQQGKLLQQQAELEQEDQLLAAEEQAVEEESGAAPTIVEPELDVSEMYETLDPTIRPQPFVNTWLQENAQLFKDNEQGLLDEYSDIDLNIESPTYPVLARPNGLSRDVDINRMNQRIESMSNAPLMNLNPEGTSTPGARIRTGQPQVTRNVARGAMPPPQGRSAEPRRLGLSDAFDNLTNLGRFITQLGATSGNIAGMAGNILFRVLGRNTPAEPTETGIESVDTLSRFVSGMNRSWTDPDAGTGEEGDPYRVDPMRGYFGEYGAGLTGAGIAGVSAIGNIAAASIYSVSDLTRGLDADYNIGWLNRTGPGFIYQLYRGATEGVSGNNLPGGRDLYTVPGFRYRQVFNFTDLGFTNLRRPNDSRYLATIDPEAPLPVQIAQGALGLALDAGALGWVDDAAYGLFARGGRLVLRGMRPLTSIPPSVTPPPSVIPDPWVTPPSTQAVTPAPVSPGDLDVWESPTIGGLEPAPVYRPDSVERAIPPGAPSVSELAPALPLPVNRGQGYVIPDPWELPNDVPSVVTRATTPEGSTYVTPSGFIRAFENNRFLLPPAIEPRTREELTDIARSVFPEIGEDIGTLTTREARVLDDLSNGLVAPYGRRHLRQVHPAPPRAEQSEVIYNAPFGRRDEVGDLDEVITRQNPASVVNELTPDGGRPPFRASLDVSDGTVLNAAGERVQIIDLNDIEYRQFVNEMGLGLQGDAWVRGPRRTDIRAVPDQPADVIQFPTDRTTPPLPPDDSDLPARDRIMELLATTEEYQQQLQRVIDNPELPIEPTIGRTLSLQRGLQDLYDEADEIMQNPVYNEPVTVRIESDIAYARNQLQGLGGEATREQLRAALPDMDDGEFAVTLNDLLKNDIIVSNNAGGYVLTEFGVNMETLGDFEYVLDVANRLSRQEETLTRQAIRDASGRLSDEEFDYVWRRLKRDANVAGPDDNVRVISERYADEPLANPERVLDTPEEVALQSLGTKTEWVQEQLVDLRKSMDDLNERLIDMPTLGDVGDEIAMRTMYGADRYEVPSQRSNVRLQRLKSVDGPSQEVLNTGDWFHGTRNAITDLNTIDPKVGSSSNELGAGIYLTRNQQLAEVYAQAERSITNPRVEGRQLPNGQVLQTEVLVGKTLKAEDKVNQTSLGTIRQIVAEELGQDVAAYYEPRQVRDMWLAAREAYHKAKNGAPMPELDFQRFQARMSESLQVAGFDSIYDKMSDTLVVLDPVSITTKRAMPITQPTMSPRAARLAGDSILRALYPDSPAVEGLVTQAMLKMENEMMDSLINEYNLLTSKARELADDIAERGLKRDIDQLDQIEDRIRTLESTIERTVEDTIEPEIIRGVEDTCL